MTCASGPCGRTKFQLRSTEQLPRAGIRALLDALCFSLVDPDGFLIAELDGAPAATISCVNYSASFAFLGFYIVREDLRGRGHGPRIWNAAIAHAGPRVIGLHRALVRDGRFAAWGVIHPCWMGNKIGPLVGDDRYRGRRRSGASSSVRDSIVALGASIRRHHLRAGLAGAKHERLATF